MENTQNNFRRALLDATLTDYEEIQVDPSVGFSPAFARKTKRALRKNCAGRQPARRFPVKRIVLIAAILSLLVFSVVADPVSNDGQWIVLVDENGNGINRIKIAMPYENSSNAPETIRQIYLPTYLPEGYYDKYENVKDTKVWYEWQDDHYDYITFSQTVLEEEHIIPLILPNEHTCELLTIDNQEILRISIHYEAIYVWSDGVYFYRLDFFANNDLPNEEEQVKVLQSLAVPTNNSLQE